MFLSVILYNNILYKMTDIKIISYPRSGHHLLEKILFTVFTDLGLEYSYCENYTHCKQNPCKDKRIFQKDHLINPETYNYDKKQKKIFLFREDTIYQLEAYFRYQSANKYKNFSQKLKKEDNRLSVTYNYNKPLDYNNKRIFSELLQYINKNKFHHKKWKDTIKKNSSESDVIIEYYDLLKEPKKYIIKILNLYNNNIKYSENTIEKSLEKINIFPDNKKISDSLYKKIYSHISK